jgi:hypothetical protein
MSTLTTILTILWVIYIINSLFKRNWNDFFYGVCFLWVCLMEMPSWLEISALILLIIIHRLIKQKENQIL